MVSKSLRLEPQTAPDGRPPALIGADVDGRKSLTARGESCRGGAWRSDFILKTGSVDASINVHSITTSRFGHLWHMFCPRQGRLRQRAGDGFAVLVRVSRALHTGRCLPLDIPAPPVSLLPRRAKHDLPGARPFPVFDIVAVAGFWQRLTLCVAPVDPGRLRLRWLRTGSRAVGVERGGGSLPSPLGLGGLCLVYVDG